MGMRGSLLGKIVIVQILVVFLVMGVMGFRDYDVTRTRMQEDLRSQAEVLTVRVAHGLGMHMWNFDHNSAEIQLAAELRNETVIGFVVEEESSLWLAVAENEAGESERLEAEDAITALQEAAVFVEEHPVFHGERETGTIQVYFTDAVMRSRLADTRQRTLLMTLAMGVILAVSLSLVLHTMVVRPVRRIVTRLQDIAQGDADLTQKLEAATRDEIGDFSRLFNTFVDTIRSLAVTIKESVRKSVQTGLEVAEKTDDAFKATENISGGLSRIKDGFQGLASDIEDSTTAIEQILGNIDELQNTAQNQASAVTQSSASIEEMVSSIRSISDTANKKTELATDVQGRTEEGSNRIGQTNAMVQEIGADVEKMSEIVNVINSITNQTNLLAMNAAIEAAHAGESGKGFAVVAEEIRNLAESTKENSRTIKETLKDVVERIKLLEDSSNHTAGAFEEIKTGVQDVHASFQEISQAMNEMQSGAQNINEAMQSLTSISLEVKEGTGEMQTGARTINNSMQNVRSVTSDVGEHIAQIEEEGNAIARAMDAIKHLIDRNQELNDELDRETERFKTE